MKVAADFRREAREALHGNWISAVVTGLVASILGATGGGVDFSGFIDLAQSGGGSETYSSGIAQLEGTGADTLLAGLVLYLAIIVLLITLAQFILGCIVMTGYAAYNLDLIDRRPLSPKRLFAYFPQWKTMLKAGLLQALYVFLWSLLFIIPGIIAGYRYAMTAFILAENPHITATEALERSKAMMDGNKWRLFCLSFSFIGWSILCIFTLGIGFLWLTPYEMAADAAFYREISRPLSAETPTLYLQESILGG